MMIRRESPADIGAIRSVTAAAFAREGQPDEPSEVGLVDRLRAHRCWLEPLSRVAVDTDGTVVGHVVCTRGTVGDDVPALGLGPVSVRPDRQRSGIGSALMHSVLGAADALGERLVALLGDPAYYHRFGFVAARRYGVTPEVAEWEPYFQVLPLVPGSSVPRGTFRYPEPFTGL